MNSPNREEIDAKLATVEARLDGRIDGLLQRFDRTDEHIERYARESEERDRRLGERITRVEDSIASLKTTMIVTAISTVIAIVLGVGAINSTLFSNTIAAFEAGGKLGASQAEIRRQTEETAALLKQLQARAAALESGAHSQPAPANPSKRP